MFIAITLLVILCVGTMVITKLPISDRTRHEYIVTLSGVASFVALMIVLFWLVLGIPRGQYPTFSLFPIFVVSVMAGLVALRANKIYKSRYGSYPA